MLTLPRFDLARPRTLEETLALLRDRPGEALVVAGGTDAVPNLKHRLHEPKRVVHIGRLRELLFAVVPKIPPQPEEHLCATALRGARFEPT